MHASIHICVCLPYRRDSQQAAKFQAFKDAAKCISLGTNALPSICFYTLINTYNRYY